MKGIIVKNNFNIYIHPFSDQLKISYFKGPSIFVQVRKYIFPTLYKESNILSMLHGV